MFKLSLAALWPLLAIKRHQPSEYEEELENSWNHEEEVYRWDQEKHLEAYREKVLLLNASASSLQRLVR